MNLKTSLVFFILVLVASVSQAQIAKTDLNLSGMPLPKGEQTSIFFPIGLQPEILAVAKIPVEVDLKAAVVVTSRIGKGKLLLTGSNAYYRAPLIKKTEVQTFIEKSIRWARQGTSNPKIAIAADADLELNTFVSQLSTNVYTLKDFKFKKNTDILFLTEDVKSAEALKSIETFITDGGTLIFGSPNFTINKNRQAKGETTSTYLSINDLFAKAGLFNADFMINTSEDSQAMITDIIPEYLQIGTMLPGLIKPKRLPELYVDELIIKPTMELVFKYKEYSYPVIDKIRSYYRIPNPFPIPSLEHPVSLETEEKKNSMKIGYWLYDLQHQLQQDPKAKYPGQELFPGLVPSDAKRVVETVRIAVQSGKQGLPEYNGVFLRPHTTGLYVPAGETIKITIPDLNQFMEAQIGLHDYDVTHLDQITRIGTSLIKKFALKQGTTEVYSPYGGLLMINIADTTSIKMLDVKVEGAVEAPYFKLGETTEIEWLTKIKNNPAPWAELATDKIVLTVPSYRIRNLDNPFKLMQFWDEVMDADADLAVISRKRTHNERIIVDQDVAYGSMFTVRGKIVVPDDESCKWMLDVDFMRKNGSWGTFHELGHRHQFFDLEIEGTSEVTVNLFTTYVYDKVLNKGLYNHDNIPDRTTAIAKIKSYLRDKPSYEKWQGNPFLALSMYIQIVDKFGWQPILDANKIYRNLPESQYPQTNQEKCDLWFSTICKTTDRNLTDFFKVWQIPVSEAAQRNVKTMKQWFPEELNEFYKR
jgi:hypothetical protein